jgi:acetolactate synthase-1/2/3 large subunit
MGFALPAAIGAKLARPDAEVWVVAGDGGFQMTQCELATLMQEKLDVKIAIIDNGFLGMVRQWQEFFYDRRYSHSYMDSLPDFVRLAEAFGHVGMRIEKPGDVEGAFKEAFAMKNRLVLMDFITDQTENVYPMIAAGKGQHEMHLAPSAEATTSDRELA